MTAPAKLPRLRIDYQQTSAKTVLAESDVLAVIGFGANAAALDNPAYIRVALEPFAANVPIEVWRGRASVERGRTGAINWSTDGDYTFAALEIEERTHGGLAQAARHAYATLTAWCQARPNRHVLRIWNYLDAINEGAGDEERYRQFCSGRAAEIGQLFKTGYPAATAIGRRDGRRTLQVYWLASRVPGTPLENPRQLNAWRYPRRYGPSAPSFARAMLAPTQYPQIYISGTAAIIGHASHHAENCLAQLDETLINLDSLLHGVRADMRLSGTHCALKVYVRRGHDAPCIEAQLRARLGAETALLMLAGDICRAELLLEIDGMHNSQ